MSILPDELARAIFDDSVRLIQADQFDEPTLRAWADVIYTQIRIKQQQKAAVMRAQLRVGDRIRFVVHMKPKRLGGCFGRVTGRQGDKVLVDIEPGQLRLMGTKWALSRNVPCPGSILEPAPLPANVSVLRSGATVERMELGSGDVGSLGDVLGGGAR